MRKKNLNRFCELEEWHSGKWENGVRHGEGNYVMIIIISCAIEHTESGCGISTFRCVAKRNIPFLEYSIPKTEYSIFPRNQLFSFSNFQNPILRFVPLPKWNIPCDSKNGIIGCVSKMEYSIRFQKRNISLRFQNGIFHAIPKTE